MILENYKASFCDKYMPQLGRVSQSDKTVLHCEYYGRNHKEVYSGVLTVQGNITHEQHSTSRQVNSFISFSSTTKMGITYLLNMLSITKHANLHLRARDVWQLNSTTETLVLLRVIVLQSNLQLNGLNELALLLTSIIGN
jgi:hypothetical protein